MAFFYSVSECCVAIAVSLRTSYRSETDRLMRHLIMHHGPPLEDVAGRHAGLVGREDRGRVPRALDDLIPSLAVASATPPTPLRSSSVTGRDDAAPRWRPPPQRPLSIAEPAHQRWRETASAGRCKILSGAPADVLRGGALAASKLRPNDHWGTMGEIIMISWTRSH